MAVEFSRVFGLGRRGGGSAGVGEYKKCSNVVWLRRVSRARSDGIMNMHRRIGGAPEDDEVVNR